MNLFFVLAFGFAISAGIYQGRCEGRLIKAYPDALKAEDTFKKRPLTYAVQEKEATFLPFLEADMPLSLDSGAPVEHGGTWTTCVTAESAAGAIRLILASKDDDPLGGGITRLFPSADVIAARGHDAPAELIEINTCQFPPVHVAASVPI